MSSFPKPTTFSGSEEATTNAAAFTIHHADSLSFSVAWLRSRPNWSIDCAVLPGSSAPERVRPSRAPGGGCEHDELDWDVAMLYDVVDMIALDSRSAMRRVLLVEDDDVLRRNYEALLGAHRLAVCACATKSEAIAAFKRDLFDVVILDVTLGSEYEAGFDLCQQFREQRKTTPIIFLTERDEDADRISGLRLGADDYLSKTISSAFLVARINALIRRVETLLGGTTEPAAAPSERAGSRLRIDERLSRAYWLELPLDLSLTQYWILKDLFSHSGVVRSTTDLMRAASITVQPNTIVVHIKTIREAIQKITPNFACIKSERARGYRWVDDP
jgi:two-component system, OmpR family, response regulator